MRRMIRASALVIGLLALIQPLPASAQARLSDIPDGFWTARRGRIAASPNGRWRVRYGRGADWAGITAFTNVAGYWGTQILPSIAPIITTFAYPQPGTPTGEGAGAPGAGLRGQEPARVPEDELLRTLASRTEQDKRVKKLKDLLTESQGLVIALGGTPRNPLFEATPATGKDGKAAADASGASKPEAQPAAKPDP